MFIRPATPGDYAAFVALFPELDSGDDVPDREHWERDFVATTLVAESDGIVAGYCYCQVLERTGYVRNVVTVSTARRQGIGRALMQAWRRRLLESGCDRWCLNVRPDNTPAIALFDHGSPLLFGGEGLSVSRRMLSRDHVKVFSMSSGGASPGVLEM